MDRRNGPYCPEIFDTDPSVVTFGLGPGPPPSQGGTPESCRERRGPARQSPQMRLPPLLLSCSDPCLSPGPAVALRRLTESVRCSKRSGQGHTGPAVGEISWQGIAATVSGSMRRSVPGGWLPIVSALIGVGGGVALVLVASTSVGPSGLYWADTIVVPSSANAAHSFNVSFHGAAFLLWWPPGPPPGSISSGLTGVSIKITEPSGAVVQTATGCGACGGSHSWYSSDQRVGISWIDGSFGTVTLLVAI